MDDPLEARFNAFAITFERRLANAVN